MLQVLPSAARPFAAITVDIDPALLRVGHLHIGWYGIAVALAIAAGLLVARREARRRQLDPDAVLAVGGWAVAGGLVGARLLFVVDHWSRFRGSPLDVIAFQEGGLAIQGAVIGGLVAGGLYARHARLPVLAFADAAAPAVILGQAIGRFGCLVTGDALGAPTSLPWGVRYVNPAAMAPQLGVPFQPVFAYEALFDVAVFALLWTIRKRVTRPGRLFALYLGLYAIGKFGVTFLRQERTWAWGMQEAQFLALALLAGAVAFWALGLLRNMGPAAARAAVGSEG
ncbi:MAG: prolipoprotein diacylglyceryl transferase [Chloroflexi bacterium]|nr:prolipoprotein diacylglyceryl transferase [Chloroflexota bacterium]